MIKTLKDHWYDDKISYWKKLWNDKKQKQVLQITEDRREVKATTVTVHSNVRAADNECKC